MPPVAWAADRVFDGRSVLPNHAVLVDGDRITDVVPRATVPAGVPVHAVPNTTLLPGLIDAHVHWMRYQGPGYLASGVTTIRDTGNVLPWILDQREQNRTGPVPAILCLGPLLDGPQPCHQYIGRPCRDQADAVAAVRETAAAGVDGIKLYVLLPREWLPPMVAAAHDAGRKVAKHCLGDGLRVALRAGIDEFFHNDGVLADIWPDHPPGWLALWGDPGLATTLSAQERLADEIARRGVVATPTLAYWESQWRIRAPDFAPDRETAHTPPTVLDWHRAFTTDPPNADQWRRALAATQRFTALLHDRGVRILAGTDVPCGAIPPGVSLWHELALLEGCGLSARQALESVTSAAADFLGCPDRGRLGPGAVADLVVVRGDPTARIPTAPAIVEVVRGGRPYQPADLLARADALATSIPDDPWGQQLAHLAQQARAASTTSP